MQINTAALHRNKNALMRSVLCCLVLVCLVGTLSKTVFAQTTYIITDGEKTTVHTSNLSNPMDVLDQAGHALGDDDLYSTQVTEDGTTEIVIQRAQTITVNHCGDAASVVSYGETVEELLIRLGIPVYEDYRISHELSEQTYDGMELNVVLVQEQEQTYTVELPFKTTYGYDPLLAEGEEVIIAPGKVGQATRTDMVLFENGVETSRTMLEETVTQQPASQYILRGTGEQVGKVRTKPLIGDGFIVTVDGKVLTFSHSAQFCATAYTKTDEGCDEITATGTTVHKGVVAVDPTVVPYFTRMYIVSNDGVYDYGISRAEDCGGAIQGMRLDLYFDTTSQCYKFGRRACTVYFLTD